MSEDDRSQFNPSKIKFFPWPPKYVFEKYLELRKLGSVKRFWLQNIVIIILFYPLMFWALELAGTEDRIDLIQRRAIIVGMWIAIPGGYFATVRDMKKCIENYFKG